MRPHCKGQDEHNQSSHKEKDTNMPMVPAPSHCPGRVADPVNVLIARKQEQAVCSVAGVHSDGGPHSAGVLVSKARHAAHAVGAVYSQHQQTLSRPLTARGAHCSSCKLPQSCDTWQCCDDHRKQRCIATQPSGLTATRANPVVAYWRQLLDATTVQQPKQTKRSNQQPPATLQSCNTSLPLLTPGCATA